MIAGAAEEIFKGVFFSGGANLDGLPFAKLCFVVDAVAMDLSVFVVGFQFDGEGVRCRCRDRNLSNKILVTLV